MKMNLKALYKNAAKKAFSDGISAGDEKQLIAWIYANCDFDDEVLFFLVLGIGAELADLEAQKQGYISEVDRAFTIAKSTLEQRKYNPPSAAEDDSGSIPAAGIVKNK